jgi:hypothetical protein
MKQIQNKQNPEEIPGLPENITNPDEKKSTNQKSKMFTNRKNKSKV